MSTALAWSVPLLLAAILHEVAHAAAARTLGDPTAARMGRLSLNPLAHVDLVGTLVLSACISLVAHAPVLWPALKPVMFDDSVLHGRKLALFGAAGPAANALMLLAWLCVPACEMARAGVTVNAAFLLLNLLPLPPLDGWRIARGLTT